jgi:hypothetical protein
LATIFLAGDSTSDSSLEIRPDFRGLAFVEAGLRLREAEDDLDVELWSDQEKII